MADENVRKGTNQGDDDPLVDQLTAGEQSAFLDDEELNDQRPGDAEGEELTSLTAAHQGSRSTSADNSALADNSAAFNPAADGDLFGEGSGQTGAQASSANQAFANTQAGDSAEFIQGDNSGNGRNGQGNLDFDLPLGDGNSAQEGGGNPGIATAAERSAGTSNGDAGTSAGAGAIDELQLSGDADDVAVNGADADPLMEFELSGEAGSGSARNNDGLGGSGDQSGSTGSGDDDDEEYRDDDDKDHGSNGIIGTQFADNLVGTGGGDMINAKGGDDTVFGGAGDDRIMGKKGDDLLDGGLGVDTLSGGNDDDILVWDSDDAVIDGGTGIDTLRVDAGDSSDADFTTFGGSITNIETIDLQSDTGANTVTLSAQNVLDMTDNGDTLTITGDIGDSLEAGTGWTDGGFDGDGNHIYTQVVGAKTATLLVDPDITANADMLPDVATAGDDTLTGTAADDTFNGLAGDDSLTGAGGDDTLTGGLGDDTMLGGAGDDTFTFTDGDFDGAAWTDTVDGFAEGGDTDVIDLTGVSQGWTLEVDGAGAGVEASSSDKKSFYNDDDMSGTITFDDGSTIEFENIEKVDW